MTAIFRFLLFILLLISASKSIPQKYENPELLGVEVVTLSEEEDPCELDFGNKIPTWEGFERKHIVESPAVDAAGWNTLLRQRLAPERPNCRYGYKSINSFILARSAVVVNDIMDSLNQYNPPGDRFWSRFTYDIVVLKLVGQPGGVNPRYTVHHCSAKYFIAGRPATYPVHFVGQSSVNRPPKDGLGFADCRVVT